MIKISPENLFDDSNKNKINHREKKQLKFPRKFETTKDFFMLVIKTNYTHKNSKHMK